MIHKINFTNSIKKDIKLIKKRNMKMEKFKEIISLLESSSALPPKNKDHNLIGNWKGYRECHIEPDWLLIYRINNNILDLVRTGTHADLFNK